MSSTHGDVAAPADRGNTPDPTGLAAQIVQLKLDASSNPKPQTPPLGVSNPASAAATPSTTGSSSPAPAQPPRGLTSSPVAARLHIAAALTPPKATVLNEERTARERPHSYTGGLSTADLRKLQMGTLNIEPDPSASRGATPVTAKPTKQWPTFNPEEGANASLSSSTNGRPSSSSSQPGANFLSQEDVESEFAIQQQASRPPPQPQPLPAGAPRINQSPALGGFPRGPGLSAPFNLHQRPYSPAIQGGLPMQSPPATYTTFGQPLSVYDVMPTGAVDPTLARIQQQQQHGGGPNFRPNDPVAMMGMGGFAGAPGPVLYSPPPGALSHQVPPPSAGLGMYANGSAGAGGPFYTPQELYAHADASLSAAARMQQQYLANAYNPALAQPPNAALNQLAAASANLQAAAVAAVAAVNATNSGVSAGPSANNRKLGLYKTELCRSWEEKGTCRYGTKCQFAHGQDELRNVQRHPKYKTEICRTFWVSGSCPYGKRCCFIHTDVPAGGLPPGADGTPPPLLVNHSRSHSSSTASDSAESSSLLQRISAQRAQGVVAQTGTPIDKPATPTSAGFRPGGLRVDTASLGGVSVLTKGNKSAYPSFPQGPNPLKPHPAPEPSSALSPLPVTAHPDFGGRRGADLAHLDVGTASQARMGKAKAASPNNRHSFNGTDLGLDFSNVGPGSLATPVQTTGGTLGRSSGHMRSGSAGNWAALSRPSRLGSSPYSPIPSADVNTTSPWTASNSELTSLT